MSQLTLRHLVSGQTCVIDSLTLEALIYMSDKMMKSLADPNLIVEAQSALDCVGLPVRPRTPHAQVT
ncbi:hypothetical protein GCM10022252_78530 [Streptosporangium oxazolinicum]|uniref:Uncharacterized protein n=1 Tax=Streptosporangium oxazolinicum TaxID=909287 RepID=A0ABP8BMK1_9ACTN